MGLSQDRHGTWDLLARRKRSPAVGNCLPWHSHPPAGRLISRLHGSFGEHFFEAVDAFWGPSLALALAPALAQGRQTKALTRQDMGPRRSPPIHFRPQQKRYSLLRRQSSSPSSPPDSPGEWQSGDFRLHLHQAPRKLGKVPSSLKHQIFSHGKAPHSLARLQDRLFIQYFPAMSIWGCPS